MFPVFHGHDGLFVSIMSFTLRKQYDSMQCGIACLQMVCKYFGRGYSSDFLLKLCFASTEGVSLLDINEAANTLGLHTICARTTIMMLSEAPLPCILHWNQNHFVVLYKVKKAKSSISQTLARERQLIILKHSDGIG